MDRRSIVIARRLRDLSFGCTLGLIAFGGCSNDGYEGKEFGQEFKKPANYPTKSLEEPDAYEGENEESPRERRGGALKGEG